MADRRTVAEGAFTAPVLARIASERGIEMPIVQAVDGLLQGATVDSVLEELLSRPPRKEGL
jgi:glycerol-3-phosphate dehydrogenase (NAD(P)+)